MNLAIIRYRDQDTGKELFEVVVTLSKDKDSEQSQVDNKEEVVDFIPVNQEDIALLAFASTLNLAAMNAALSSGELSSPEKLLLQIFMAGRKSVLNNHWSAVGDIFRKYMLQVSDERLGGLYKKLHSEGWANERTMPLSTRNADEKIKNEIMHCMSVEIIERREGRIPSVSD